MPDFPTISTISYGCDVKDCLHLRDGKVWPLPCKTCTVAPKKQDGE